MRVIVMTSLAVEWLSGIDMPVSMWSSLIRDDDAYGKEGRVKRPESCRLVQIAECEDCPHWEPIPYHAAGGVCLVDGAPATSELPSDVRVSNDFGRSVPALLGPLQPVARPRPGAQL